MVKSFKKKAHFNRSRKSAKRGGKSKTKMVRKMRRNVTRKHGGEQQLQQYTPHPPNTPYPSQSRRLSSRVLDGMANGVKTGVKGVMGVASGVGTIASNAAALAV